MRWIWLVLGCACARESPVAAVPHETVDASPPPTPSPSPSPSPAPTVMAPSSACPHACGDLCCRKGEVCRQGPEPGWTKCFCPPGTKCGP
ncbi:MAG: hypothetical protein IPJ34_24700 [Myxococcales bacterium]|nr:hypothetical protein [Myxococcales bacterium]